MKDIRSKYREQVGQLPTEIQEEIDLSLVGYNKIEALIQEHGLSKMLLADKIRKYPSETIRWVGVQHNFNVSTLAMLSVF